MTPTDWRLIVQRLGYATRTLRHQLGWSQQQLADQAAVSQGAISRLEAGHMYDVPLHTVFVVLRVLCAGSQQLTLPLDAPMRALQEFLTAFDGTITVPIDPTLAALLKVYHSIPPTQQRALVTFLRAAVPVLVPAQEVA